MVDRDADRLAKVEERFPGVRTTGDFAQVEHDDAVDAVVSRTLVKNGAGTVTVFAFDEGQELTDHTAAKPAVVQVVSGRIRLDLDGDPAAEFFSGLGQGDRHG